MARIRWHGSTYSGTLIEQNNDGDWLVEMHDHGPRFTIGTKIQVKAADIESMDAVEPLQSPEQSAAVLDKAMAAERKTLPTVQELLAQAKQPSPAPDKPPPAQDNPDMSKLSALADLAASTTKDIEAEADRASVRLTDARAKAMKGIGRLDGVSAEIEKGIAAVEDLANQLSNGGPPLEK